MVKILQKEDELLRVISKPVPIEEIGSTRVKKILADMKEAMNAEDDAVAIAAPQIGIPLRIFVVSGKVLTYQKEPQAISHSEKESQKIKTTTPPDLVFINPEVIKQSQKKTWVEEGCLSVRWLYGEVKRSERATVQAYNEKGERFTRGGSGILAQIFEHETEHLDGVLFIDKAREITDIPPVNPVREIHAGH